MVALTLQFELLPAILPGLASAQAGSFANGQAAIAGISSGAANVVLTGKPKAFLTGFGQGFLSFGGGIAIRAVIGGAFSEIRGGSFKSGFLSAGFTAAALPFAPRNVWSGAAFSAAVGGTASILGGGKFADGAVTGAFAYAPANLATRSRAFPLEGDEDSSAISDAKARQEIFNEGKKGLIESGLLPEKQKVIFRNRFAVFKRAADGTIVRNSVRTFDTFAKAQAAVDYSKSIFLLNGRCCSNDTITIYAGATNVRTSITIGEFGETMSVDYRPVLAVQFTILHELQHYKGVGYGRGAEGRINRKVHRLLGQ